jgi:hypothetical protein
METGSRHAREPALVLAAALRAENLRRPLHPPPARRADDLFRPGAGSARAGETRRHRRRSARRRRGPRKRRRWSAAAYADAVGVYLAFASEQSIGHVDYATVGCQPTGTRLGTHLRDKRFRWCGTLPKRIHFRACRGSLVANPSSHRQSMLCLLACRGHALQADARTQDHCRSGCFHRPTLLRQHRLRRPLGLLLRVAASLAEASFPRAFRHAGGTQGRGTGGHALPPRQQAKGRDILPRWHDAGDAPARRAGASSFSRDHLLCLQAGGKRRRGRHDQYRLGHLSRCRHSKPVSPSAAPGRCAPN